MKLTTLIVAGTVLATATGALAQSSSNGTPGAVPGLGPGGNGSQSGGGTAVQGGAGGGQAAVPGSVTVDPDSPTNTTGQPAGDKPAQ